MADEPRRSGRATKGQHTKNEDDDPTAAVSTPKATPAPSKAATTTKGKGGNKKSKKDEATPENGEAADGDEEEDDSIIRCVCGATADEDGWPMICCDKCEAWQHNLCMGISENDDELPEKYYCEQCRPSEHRSLLAAMKKGEKPWEPRIKERRKEEEEERKKKKKGKGGGGGRKSTGTPAKGTPAPTDSGNKRKFEETPVEVKKSASPAVAVTPIVNRRKSSAPVVVPEAKRRKSTIDAGHSRKPSVVIPAAAASIEDLPTNRQPAAKAINTKSKSVIDALVKEGSYRIPDGETAASLATSLALQVENALLAIYGDPTAYKQQFLAIHSNLPKNSQLVLQLLGGALTAAEIAEMSTDDMASEEVQRERARAKEEADKQSILITEQGPRVRKTHKGEELVEENRAGDSGIDDASWTRPVRRDTQDANMMDVDEDEGAHDDERVELPEDADNRHPPPLSVDTKRKPSNYNIDRAWNAAHSPDQPSYAASAARAQAPRTGGGDTQMHDADIDRLLKDEEDEEAPPSPAIDGTPGAPVWKGRVDMAGVAQFTGSARWAAGGDVGQKVSYSTLLPGQLAITGRIAVARADEYVAGMRFSSSNDVCCLDVTPSASARANALEFAKIWSYFSEKGRWGVLDPKGLGPQVRDAYLVTLPRGEGGGVPDFLTMLENKDEAVLGNRERDMLILTLVVKTRSPLSTPAPTAPAQSATPQLPQQSPVVTQSGLPPNGSSASSVAATVGSVPSYPWATPLVQDILGPDFINAPAVVQLFSAVPEMSEVQVRNLREALNENPGAGADLSVLGEVLKKGVGQ